MRLTAARRVTLGVPDRETRPWTSRSSTRLRGLSKQLSPVNFCHELLDLRFVDSCRRRGITELDTASPPEELLVDARQECGYQLAGGSTTLLSGSRIYSYALDRCFSFPEHMQFNGWSCMDTRMQSCADDVLERIEQETGVTTRGKKRRGCLVSANM